MITKTTIICTQNNQPKEALSAVLIEEPGIGAETVNVSKLYPQSQICAVEGFQSLQFGQR